MRPAAIALFVFALSVQTAAGQETDSAIETRIKAAIEQLGDSSFDVRQAAQRDLLKIGLIAEKSLQEALRSPDVEIRDRAKFVLAEFARQKIDAELEKVNWQTILDRVKKHATGEEWKQAGFSDPLIERAVEKLISQVNIAAKEDRVMMPVRFADCTAKRDDVRMRPGSYQLICAQGSAYLGRGDHSIFLIDGSADFSFANNCLIIARGAVSIAHSSSNVVLAGQFIDISHDGSHARPGTEAAGTGSLVMSGSILRISHANRAICSAPTEMVVGSTNCVLINPAPMLKGPVATNRQVNDVKIVLQPLAPSNPLRDPFKITQVIHRGDSNPGFVVIEHNGVEVVQRPGVDIKDNMGKPVAAVEGWKLSFVNDKYALFSNGKEDAGFVLPRGQ